jgi:hypothetical protein
MIVTIPACQDHGGYKKITIEISDYCPVCGAKRGVPNPIRSYDGSLSMIVDGWLNNCGHIDTYRKVREEYLKNNAEQEAGGDE